MIKTYFFTIVFILLVQFAPAQEFYGGVLAGFNGSQLEGDASSGYNKMGLVGGVWTQRDISSDFYWGMELKVNQKGSRKLINKYDNWHYVYRLNYIDLPVLIGYRYKPYLSVFTGLSYGYLFNKNASSRDGKDPMILYDDISDWEMGMFIGVKVDLDQLIRRNWASNFVLETRYQYSTISIDSDHDFFTYYLSIGQYNNVISTVLYYQIEWPSGQ